MRHRLKKKKKILLSSQGQTSRLPGLCNEMASRADAGVAGCNRERSSDDEIFGVQVQLCWSPLTLLLICCVILGRTIGLSGPFILCVRKDAWRM